LYISAHSDLNNIRYLMIISEETLLTIQVARKGDTDLRGLSRTGFVKVVYPGRSMGHGKKWVTPVHA
jgi:hypothetical protein